MFLSPRELASGTLVQISRITLPGYGFYIVYRPGDTKLASIKAFLKWALSMEGKQVSS